MRAVVERVKRGGNSQSGNPNVRVVTDQGTYLTGTDSHSGYVALGLEPGDVVDLTITEGRIEHIGVVESQESTEEA